MDMAGGHAQLMFGGPAASIPMITDGKIVALAVNGPPRNPLVQARLAELGNDLGSGASPEELSRSLRAAFDKQGATLRALGVKPQDLGG